MNMSATKSTAVASLAARYGDDTVTLESVNEVLRTQLAHRSVRKFRVDPVGDAEVTAMVAAGQSAATSSNLQSWSVVAVRDRERKTRLMELARGQRFIDEAPLLLVWVADLGRARRMAQRSQQPLEGADYLETTLVAFIDVALAAQNAALVAESLGLGTVFIGAMRDHPEEVAAELDFPPHVAAAFGMAVGLPDPSEQAGIKPRLPQTAVLHQERYGVHDADAKIPRYDERLSAYNAQYGRPGNWSDRVLARLAGPQSLSGRHLLRTQLQRLGFPSR